MDIKHGSILIVGGGPAGKQAALDCAEAGFKVWLLEKEAAVGGTMARLDKTFPSNDCAMCMLSPKLVETGRHLNIEIISNAELESLHGEAGDFTAIVRKRPRFVDEKKCNGCGDCEAVCPVTLPDPFNGGLSGRKAIFRLYPQAIPNAYAIDKASHPPPCRGSCPAGVNAQGYIALTAQGKFAEALAVVRLRMPFAGICGRICHHPCEENCNRKEIDEPLAVRHLKKFLADYEREQLSAAPPMQTSPPPPAPTPERKEKIAIIGAGPAGLTCACTLAEQGFQTTVFEKEARPGGMMRYGIPAYRLDREFLNHEIGLILDRHPSIEIKYHHTLGNEITLQGLRESGYSAIFIATGASRAKRLPLEGAHLNGVCYGIPFLKGVNQGETPTPGKRVAVIGGGNVALDAARSALRLPGVRRVDVYCLEPRERMPAHDWEINETLAEHIHIHNGWGPLKITGQNGNAKILHLVRCTSVWDETGRFAPRFDHMRRKRVPADAVILSVGQEGELETLPEELKTGNGRIDVSPLTLETSLSGVFAGGDIASGPSSLVEAVAQGRRAAESIHRLLDRQDLNDRREPPQRAAIFAEIPRGAHHTRNPRVSPQTEMLSPAQAVAEAQRCLQCGICSLCMQCVSACKAGAIDHAMPEQTITLSVGAVVLAPGFRLFDISRKSQYGFRRFANVVDSLQFERMLSASGPFKGHLQRLSDGKTPQRIAWIQCAGSRDAADGLPYCSAICCMAAVKAAMVAREHVPGLETSIFYIDMRPGGKGCEPFIRRGQDKYGLRLIRSMISSVRENPANKRLRLAYSHPDNHSGLVEEEFDIVVLSSAIISAIDLSRFPIPQITPSATFGFFVSPPSQPLQTNIPGIFYCGAAGGPADIPGAVSGGSAAAALCGQLLHPLRFSQTRSKTYPPDRDTHAEEPRIGVFVCHCGSNIASVINIRHVVDYVRNLPGVTHVSDFTYTCSQDAQENIKKIIAENQLNRIIVASCTPRTHEPLFRETLREAGLNRFLFEMADIREQCSWVHRDHPERATAKAETLVRGGVAKAALLQPLWLKRIPVAKAALVIGAGISGLTAALTLADQGFQVYVLEKTDRPGGQLLRLRRSMDGFPWNNLLQDMLSRIAGHPHLHLFANARLQELTGSIGAFTSRVQAGEELYELRHGVTIIASGADEYQPLPGEWAFPLVSPLIIDQRELETRLEAASDQFSSPLCVAMIQCVGGRDARHPYCSRVCCGAAIKNALRIKELFPTSEVYILYRDIVTQGFRELHYRKARQAGVRFIHFPDDRYPEIRIPAPAPAMTPLHEQLPEINVWDTVLNKEIQLKPNLIVLSRSIEPDQENNRSLAELLKLPREESGFFMEAHVKLLPVDFANAGFYVCGLAHSPKYTGENIIQALAAAGRAATVLAREYLEAGGAVSFVQEEKCAACLTCVRECLYNAPFINPQGKAHIEASKCRGCGNCAAACPAKAIQLLTFTDSQQLALLRGLLNPMENKN